MPSKKRSLEPEDEVPRAKKEKKKVEKKPANEKVEKKPANEEEDEKGAQNGLRQKAKRSKVLRERTKRLAKIDRINYYRSVKLQDGKAVTMRAGPAKRIAAAADADADEADDKEKVHSAGPRARHDHAPLLPTPVVRRLALFALQNLDRPAPLTETEKQRNLPPKFTDVVFADAALATMNEFIDASMHKMLINIAMRHYDCIYSTDNNTKRPRKLTRADLMCEVSYHPEILRCVEFMPNEVPASFKDSPEKFYLSQEKLGRSLTVRHAEADKKYLLLPHQRLGYGGAFMQSHSF